MFERMREPLWSLGDSRLIASLPAGLLSLFGGQLASLVSRSKLSLLCVSRLISVDRYNTDLTLPVGRLPATDYSIRITLVLCISVTGAFSVSALLFHLFL
jgi:hypothetical protein